MFVSPLFFQRFLHMVFAYGDSKRKEPKAAKHVQQLARLWARLCSSGLGTWVHTVIRAERWRDCHGWALGLDTEHGFVVLARWQLVVDWIALLALIGIAGLLLEFVGIETGIAGDYGDGLWWIVMWMRWMQMNTERRRIKREERVWLFETWRHRSPERDRERSKRRESFVGLTVWLYEREWVWVIEF